VHHPSTLVHWWVLLHSGHLTTTAVQSHEPGMDGGVMIA
jgi:hypothetical protein